MKREGRSLAARLAALFGGGKGDAELLEELEETLIEADFGGRAATEIVDHLRGSGKLASLDEALGRLKELLHADLLTARPVPPPDVLSIYLVLGVNGVGKTTTIAKLAEYYRREHDVQGIALAAADTFRAAAIEQLRLHGRRLDLRVVSQQPGSDPGAVVYDAITSARARGERLLLVDTAGRMHSKADLVKELVKIDRIIRTRSDGEYHRLLVIDATTGQNALSQAETFHRSVGVDSVVLAKADSTAGGGIVVPICRTVGLPFSFMGVGEKPEDLRPFDPDRYLDGLLGLAS